MLSILLKYTNLISERVLINLIKRKKILSNKDSTMNKYKINRLNWENEDF